MTPHEERLIEAVARAINRGSFDFHRMEPGEEERMWKETQIVRRAQASAAIAAYRTYDERRQCALNCGDDDANSKPLHNPTSEHHALA